MMGKSSGFIDTLPRQVRARIEFLRELQEKHDDLFDDFNKEMKALREKYEALYGMLPISANPYHTSSRLQRIPDQHSFSFNCVQAS